MKTILSNFSATEIDKFGTSSLITRNTTDVNVIQTFLIMLFRIGILTPMMAGIGLILSVAFTGQLAAVLAVAIQNAMAVFLKGRTSFVIAHRLSTIRDANVILYMENGDIKEVGDHDTLMKKGRKYAVLYNSQFG